MPAELQRPQRATSRALVPTTTPESTVNLVRNAVADTVDLLQAHVQLAALEVREDARAAARVATVFTLGGALALLAIGFLGVAGALALSGVVPVWAAFSIIGVVIGIGAAATIARGRRILAAHDFRPERTIEMVEENRQWLANRTSEKSS